MILSHGGFAIEQATSGSSRPFISDAGDAIFVWVAIYGADTVANVTDSNGDPFTLIINKSMAYGSGGSSNGLSVWLAASVTGGSATTLSVTLHPRYTNSPNDSAIAFVDVTGVAASPLDAVGPVNTSSNLTGQASRTTVSDVDARAADCVLSGVAARNYDNFTGLGGAVRVDQAVGVLSAPSRNAMTVTVFESGQGPVDGPLWVNASSNQTSAWVAAALAVRGSGPGGPREYWLTFTQRGLPDGAGWGVTVGSITVNVTAPEAVRIAEANGTYAYTDHSTTAFTASPAGGTLTVQGASTAAGTIQFTADPIRHVVALVLENNELASVLQSGPYESYLWKHYGHASAFYAACHESKPEYTALTSGRAFGCGSFGVEGVQNLGDLVDRAGLNWAGYFESMPTACDSASAFPYTIYHDPFLSYSDVVKNSSRCDSHLLNSRSFNQSLANGTLPAFALYIPNEVNDCHNSTIASCDGWLKDFLSPILNSSDPLVQGLLSSTVFFIAYDEGSTNLGYSVGGLANPWCQSTTGHPLSVCGGHSYMVAVSPFSASSLYADNATDYSVQTTIEWLLGLGSDGGYDGSPQFPPMESLFSF